MKCYIRKKDDFYHVLQRDELDYDLVPDSMNGDGGRITLLGEYGPELTGAWLTINGETYLVDKASPNKGKTDVRLLPPDTLFDRDVHFSGTEETTIGGYIAEQITAGWIDQTDAVYAAPYLSCVNTDDTPFVEPEQDEYKIFNLLKYIRWARSTYNIAVRIGMTDADNDLKITISREEVRERTISDNDGHTQLISADFDASALAKLTVFQPFDTGEKDEDDKAIMDATESIWYLAADGSVSQEVPAERAVGEWGTLTIGKDDEPEEKVKEEFDKNESAHKIEFYSDFELRVGDTVHFRFHDSVFDGTITAIKRKRSDSRKRYAIGDMITTLSERLERSKQ